MSLTLPKECLLIFLPAIEVLNLLPGRRAKGERPSRSLSHNAKQEEAALRLMLERREAELREAMKLRHSFTTLLHALRGDMEQFLESTDMDLSGRRRLNEAETALGEHVTGGVVQSWRTVQKKLQDALSEGPPAEETDHYKLLVQLETELAESQQLVRFQQQLLQDSVASPLPSELSDSYFLEEWERLQMSWEEFDRQRRTFEKERQAFTDAAIRLSRERCDFGRQKASLVKQMFVCDSPLFGQRASRRESSSFNYSVLGPINISGCLPFTPSSTESGNAAVPEERLPSTPELYSALGLSYHYRSVGPQRTRVSSLTHDADLQGTPLQPLPCLLFYLSILGPERSTTNLRPGSKAWTGERTRLGLPTWTGRCSSTQMMRKAAVHFISSFLT
ncbi:transcript variant X1 [Nothobranchius furzeri]|uniref:Transcript variant X1 n=1 Tax=Nothobranchius furzeri TaxID=105023 RepID=A0A9D2YCP5_NOTFU|nr:transcript variant X1 [Nothobranchius furzeri]